ncbi:hypothetical protein D3C78_1231620 [compost metagenome]
MCAFSDVKPVGNFTSHSGCRRCDDDAGGAPGSAARLPTQRAVTGAELRDHAGAGWADYGADAGRLAGDLRHLALDFPYQYPDWPARHLLCA